MKWLFATLVALNIIVFASIIAVKMFYIPQSKLAEEQQKNAVQPIPPQVVITTQVPLEVQPSPATTDNPNNAVVKTTPNRVAPVPRQQQPSRPTPAPKQRTKTTETTDSANKTTAETATAEVKNAMPPPSMPRHCTARVSIPADDYHRIKGLLRKWSHTASRQVVRSNNSEGVSQTAEQMNVSFSSITNEDVAQIQGIVGRYGSLQRSGCNR